MSRQQSQSSPTPQTGVIIPAAGFGTRMGTTVPKQFLELAGEPILVRTIAAFLKHPSIGSVVVVLPKDHLQSAKEQIYYFVDQQKQFKLSFVVGGDSRQQSVQNGLTGLAEAIEYVLVHDGARPMVTSGIIDRCISGINDHGAVIAAVPVKDTLKEVDGISISRTIDRSRLWQAQTPQGMQRRLLEQAYEYAQTTSFTGTDEASLLEHAGIAVSVILGSEKNIKITRPDDLTVAAGLLKEKQSVIKKEMIRIGHGFDAHRLVQDRKLILGGVEIPYGLGLAGHSDADVLVHALMDGILGALGAGDIGRHFPDTDDQYQGADSLKLLAKVMELVRKRKMQLTNGDITVICQQPKLAPHLSAMRANIAAVCDTLPDNINIKATTTEKMGFTGRGEGISSHAVVLLQSQ